MLVDQLHLECCLQLVVENFHRLKCPTRQNHAQRAFLLVVGDLFENVAWVQTLDTPLRHVLHRLFTLNEGFVGANVKFEIFQLGQTLLLPFEQIFNLVDLLEQLDDVAQSGTTHLLETFMTDMTIVATPVLGCFTQGLLLVTHHHVINLLGVCHTTINATIF